LTASTRQFYRAKLAVFVAWCDGEGLRELARLSAHDLRRFLVHIQRRQLSSQYQNNLARAIRAFLNYCVRDELLDKSPFDKVQMPRLEKKILQAFSAQDLQRILRHCVSGRDRALCLFLLDSGVRASELLALTVDDVNVDTGEVWVRAGKGQKQRTCYIGVKTRKQLKRYLVGRETLWGQAPLFASETTGERLTISGMVQLMKRLGQRAGVDHCTCHTFRRTFALTCLRNGMNIYVLARLMGHSDIVILRQYLPLVEADLQRAHQEFGAVDSLIG
jgi:integrase/recombinase XerD